MTTAYHTHEFQIPTASDAEVAAGTETGKVVTPATLGSSTAFATAAQGALADTALQPADVGTAAAEDVGYFATSAQGALADTATQPADLATVATSGSYADLSGLPTLGTAAAAAVGDFATAAQGAKADTIPAIAANTMLVDNAAGTERETKTFAEVVELLSLGKNIRHYGGSGTADNATAIAAMAADAGFVTFPHGPSPISTNLTVGVPVYFAAGAFVDVASGVTLSIANRILSPNQHIFRGDGDVKLTITETSGEDSRMVHASWFGVLPKNQDPVDQSDNINKMFSAMSQNREGVIDFDSGSYFITWDALDPIPRGVWIRGSGIRRTTFDMLGTSTAASKLFRTGGDAGKITGIQFEHPEGDAASVHLGTAISLDHNDWYVEDIRCWDTQFGVALNGSRCEAHNIQSIYGIAMPADSALVQVNGGGGVADTVRVYETTFGPAQIVRLGGPSSTEGIRNFRVSNVRTNKYSIGVKLHARQGMQINGVTIDNVTNTANEEDTVAALVHLLTEDNASINLATMGGLLTNSSCESLVRIDQNSTAYIRDVIIASGVAVGLGKGVVLNRTAGTLSDITIASAVDVDDRSPRTERSGAMYNIKEPSPTVIIADDTVGVISIPGTQSTAIVSVMTLNGADATAPRGLFLVRSGAAPVALSMASTANITFTTGVLADGSGTDGNVTISTHSDGMLYISNRAGSSRTIGLQFLAPT